MIIPFDRTRIAQYLIERGLLERKAVVDGDVIVAELTSRHRNFALIRREGPGYFVKQIQPSQSYSAETLAREAACYEMAQKTPGIPQLASLMPKFHLYDPERHMIVLEFLPNAENLGALFARSREFPEDLAVEIARGLGTYHSQIGDQLKDQPQQAIFPRMAPWILSLHRNHPSAIQNLSAGNAQLMSLLQRYPGFTESLDALAAEWRTDTLIHGDMKFENCVQWRNGSNAPTLKVVDWELADIGDACWDVAAILQGYLNQWLYSMPAGSETNPDRLVEKAVTPLEKIQPAMRAFWNAYVATMGLSDGASEQLLDRCARHSAARMLQTVFEALSYSQQMTPYSIVMLQTSLNMLQNPREATRVLLGLGREMHAIRASN
jgi:hypothetical protein